MSLPSPFPDPIKKSNNKPEKEKPKVKRGTGHQAQRVDKRLSGFDYEKSEVWNFISARYGSKISHLELKSIAAFICTQTNLQLDRDAKRDNRVLIKWFDENWAQIQPLLLKIHLHDENDNEILGS